MLKQQIQDQANQALKKGDRELLETLRFLISAIQNAEIDLKKEATDEEVLAVIQRQVKQHRESVEAYEKAGRAELLNREQLQLQILEKFLPQQMSEEELRGEINRILSQLPQGENNFGKIIGLVMAQVKGKAEGGLVSRLIREIIDQKA
jgi:hypothetical protein